jgi:hypothetical protein
MEIAPAVNYVATPNETQPNKNITVTSVIMLPSLFLPNNRISGVDQSSDALLTTEGKKSKHTHTYI